MLNFKDKQGMQQGNQPVGNPPQMGNWQARVFNRMWPFGGSDMRPADVSNHLNGIMLAQNSVLEDVNYAKIVPNRYIVEVNQDNYVQNYQPLGGRVTQQWTERLLRRLMTANSRLGRKEYRFGGRVKIEVRPVTNLAPSQARILFRIESDEAVATDPNLRTGVACLEMMPSGQRWSLNAPVLTIGRDAACDIVLDNPIVQQTRLISGRHAYIRLDNGRYTLFDGAPYGRPSLNGTYINRRPVSPNGAVLQNGDTIILAALDSNDPRPDTPGVVTLRFLASC
jgi:hypothetical protein